MRILVTGSRYWNDAVAINRELVFAADGRPVTVVHGDCPTGADYLAGIVAAQYPGWTEEKHPAHWGKYGKAAGPIRNQEMVDAGADVCLAFIPVDITAQLPSSRGTLDCVRRAEAAGIPVTRVRGRKAP